MNNFVIQRLSKNLKENNYSRVPRDRYVVTGLPTESLRYKIKKLL